MPEVGVSRFLPLAPQGGARLTARLAEGVAALEAHDDHLFSDAAIPCVRGTPALASGMDVSPGRHHAGGMGVVVAIALASTATGGA